MTRVSHNLPSFHLRSPSTLASSVQDKCIPEDTSYNNLYNVESASWVVGGLLNKTLSSPHVGRGVGIRPQVYSFENICEGLARPCLRFT
jgi:hypothetical protein